ncbi:MAG TPA: helix-turn-helix transcriptional regulator [Pedomonas sp.]|uniref:helix-turn-helix transcriptional regulator n=1 Tax=Pedomonas sp. TaxID=2976421 RepID=UPI002F3FBDC1
MATDQAETLAVRAFAAAPFEPAGWDIALKELARQTRSSRMQLLGIGGPHAIPFNWTSDVIDGFIEGFVRIGGGDPAINWRVAATRAPLEISSEVDYARARQGMKRSNIYDDFAARYEAVYGCQTVLLQNQGMFIGLAALRSEADGPTNEDERAVFSAAAPHVLSAIQMQRALDNQGAQLVSGSLEAVGTAAFVCDGTGRVAALTAMAEGWLRDHGSLRLIAGRLSASRPQEDRVFQNALATVLSSERPALPQRFWLGEDYTQESFHLCEIFALPRRDWSFGFEPRALVTIRMPQDLAPDHSALLSDALGLTNAEADVAIRAARGQSRDEIAQQRGASAETVNSQFKTIFRKTGVRREGELIALVNKLLR